MAKFEGILGGKIKGKVGNLVFTQVAGVGTVAREYVQSPRNPQTPAQQEQRTKLSNLVNFYRAFNGVMKGAFETKKPSQSDYNAFVGRNLTANPIALTKTEASLGAVVVAPYIISEGTLAGITGSVAGSGANRVLSSSIATSNTINYSTATVKQVSEDFLAKNAELRNGMQISLLLFVNVINGNPAVPRAAVNALEFTIDVASSELFADVTNFAGIVQNSSSYFSVSLSESVVGYAWILSDKVSGTLKVSSASVSMVDETIYNEYNTDAQRIVAAESYGESAELFLNPGSSAQIVNGGVDNGGSDNPGTGGGDAGGGGDDDDDGGLE